MNSHWFAIVALAALLAAGCRTRPEERAMFEAYQEEARQQEQRLYDLLYKNQILHDENVRLKKRLAVDAGRTRAVDEGPRIMPRISPRRDDSGTMPDDTGPDDIELTPPDIDMGPAAPGNIRGGGDKPVTPAEEPAEPSPPAVDLPDIDAPPGDPQPKPAEEPPDEPPPRPASILKRPAPSEAPSTDVLPPPRPTSKPKNPELLPAPDEKKVSRLSFQWHDEPRKQANGQQQWTPRTAERRRTTQ